MASLLLNMATHRHTTESAVNQFTWFKKLVLLIQTLPSTYNRIFKDLGPLTSLKFGPTLPLKSTIFLSLTVIWVESYKIPMSIKILSCENYLQWGSGIVMHFALQIFPHWRLWRIQLIQNVLDCTPSVLSWKTWHSCEVQGCRKSLHLPNECLFYRHFATESVPDPFKMYFNSLIQQNHLPSRGFNGWLS